MIFAVVGLGHLGTVTAACVASKHVVFAYDDSPAFALDLEIKEPGISTLLAEGLKTRQLQLTSDREQLKGATVVWITYDTPVDEKDNAGYEIIMQKIIGLMPVIRDGTIILISSQLPVGTISRLENASTKAGRRASFVAVPENLRRGKGIDTFMNADRLVVGVRNNMDGLHIRAALSRVWPFNRKVEWMSVESAEMTKHALNSFLAISIVFANEIADICKRTGADPAEVERGLRTDSRVGQKAYVRGGEPFTGGTLARDLKYLDHIHRLHKMDPSLFSMIYDINKAHEKTK